MYRAIEALVVRQDQPGWKHDPRKQAEPESELRACQALIREQAQLAEDTLADDSIDLPSLARA